MMPAMRRRLVIGCLTLLFAAGAAFFWPRGPAAPIYQGRPLSAWLADTHWPTPLSQHGAAALDALGTNAVPYLLSECFHSSQWSAKGRLSRFLPEFLRRRSDYDRNMRAFAAMAYLGPRAAAALPELAKKLDDHSTAYVAFALIDNTGVAGLPYLITAVDSHNQVIALEACRRIIARGPPAVPILLQLLAHSNDLVRIRVFSSLPAFRAETDQIVPALQTCLLSPNAEVRLCALIALDKLDAVRALQALRPLLKDPEPTCARTASNAVWRLERLAN